MCSCSQDCAVPETGKEGTKKEGIKNPKEVGVGQQPKF